MFITKKRLQQIERQIYNLKQTSYHHIDCNNNMSDVLDDLRDFADWQEERNEITTKRIQALEEMHEEDEEMCDYCQGYSDAMEEFMEEAPKKKGK